MRLKPCDYESKFLEFYYSSLEKGWYYKTCCSFAQTITTKTAFINKPGQFGDHPTRNAMLHLQSNRHENAVKNKKAFEDLSKRRTDVWKLMKNASLSQEVSKVTNRFIIKSFFRITWVLTTNRFIIKSFFQITWLLIKLKLPQRYKMHCTRKSL